MGLEVAIAVGAVVLLVATFWILTRQPHPSDDMDVVAGRQGEGPVGEPYPPGSRPAGPGAESQDPDLDTPQQP